MPSHHYDIVIIGAGPGGYVAALKAGQLGASCAIIEKHHLGGTCLNYGCIPSKALLASGELLHRIARGDELGVSVEGATFDWSAVQKRKNKVLRQLRAGTASLLKGRNVALYEGAGRLDGPGKVIVDGKDGSEALTAGAVILAVGSTPARIPGWPEDPKRVSTSDEALHWDALPRSLLIVGGGVIGCEFACMMQSFGVEVTVVEMLPGLLPGMDEDLGAALAKSFKTRGIGIHTDTKVEKMVAGADGVTADLSSGESIVAERLLIAVGRRAATDEIGLDTCGIETNRGFIEVDDRMETRCSGVYCIGDANGRCLLAHAASAQGVVAVQNALGNVVPMEGTIPDAVYTYPEVAASGLTADEARQQGVPISIGMFPIGHLGKAMAVGETEGFVKVVRHRETDELLGVHIIGHNATEIIAAANALVDDRAEVHDAAEIVFAHPTISESLKESMDDALGAALHLPPRTIHRVAAE
ncbi:MAG: dihydrolipoyl dehydrogenase [Planctomycetes bacterium]|jgi:dihydrolipoamide dehydrogenase|nr:dihydrolipoyl dehydrogenase [Phycisphaerae bacterium]NBB94809.1 dihydrolipoyl dehydrogenase [Planctomycetota bacterium]